MTMYKSGSESNTPQPDGYSPAASTRPDQWAGQQRAANPVSARSTSSGSSPSPASLLIFPIDPLPDFLEDHTLLSAEFSLRIQEHCARWVQFIRSLWKWRARAVFCLRYYGGIQPGKVQVYFLAAPKDANDEPALREDLKVQLKAQRVIEGSDRQKAILLPAEELPRLERPVILEVAQRAAFGMWVSSRGHTATEAASWIDVQDPPVTYPWWGAGGPFLLPMEMLVSPVVAEPSSSGNAPMPAPLCLSIYLEPTTLTPPETEWLRTMAKLAATQGELSGGGPTSGSWHINDPAATLAGRLYIANYRRLLAPFLVSVHCAAAHKNREAAYRLASSIESLVHELPFGRQYQEDDQLPSGSDVRGGECQAALLRQHENLFFPPAPQEEKDYPQRIRYLIDAEGAATVFRLPVSVRGGVPGIAVKQQPPDFNPGLRSDVAPPRSIILGRLHQGGLATVPIDEFRKHALVTGFTGSGKTQTLLFLLHQFWSAKAELAESPDSARQVPGIITQRERRGPNGGGIPFLVIESAKQEYRGLLGIEEFKKDLRVYTLGNEICAPFRLNPFELQEGIRLENHISRLQSCFEGALPMIGPMQSVIIEALVRVYDDPAWDLDRRWKLTEVHEKATRFGRRFPTMSEFYQTAERVIADRNYRGDIQSNVLAALMGRIKPLTRKLPTSVSRMLDTNESTPFAEIFEHPVVLELNDLNSQDKALTVMFLLTMLREYRETRPRPYLTHVTVVEEAHNVLSTTPSLHGSENVSDTRHRAVESFCAMLTEIRALGEGLIIADQSPEKLAADAMRNTNVQIAHQLRDSKDRAAVARALLMTDEQRDFLGKLQPGHAAVFFTGLERATFVTVPNYRSETAMHGLGLSSGAGFGDFVGIESGEAIRRHMAGQCHPAAERPFGEFCAPCDRKEDCAYRNLIASQRVVQKCQPKPESNRAVEYYATLRKLKNAQVRMAALKGEELAKARAEEAELIAQKSRTMLAVQNQLFGQSANAAQLCGGRANVYLARCAFLHLCYAAGQPGRREFPDTGLLAQFPGLYAQLLSPTTNPKEKTL